jgi:hypothetical protein
MSTNSENTDAKQSDKPWQFQPGQSGNPAGKPKGTRNKTTLAVQELLDGEAEALTRRAIEMALAGDITALRLCLERIAPARKDYPVEFAMPEITSAANAATVMSAVLAATASGALTPLEAGEVSKVIDIYLHALETRDIEARIRALEERSQK